MLSRIQIWLHRNLWVHAVKSRMREIGLDSFTLHTCHCGKEWATR